MHLVRELFSVLRGDSCLIQFLSPQPKLSTMATAETANNYRVVHCVYGYPVHTTEFKIKFGLTL